MKFKALKLIIAAVALMLPLNAHAEKMGIADPARDKYYSALEGKKVAYVPLAMGFDLTEGWYAGMKKALEPLGITMILRDPNWSADAGSKAISSLISEKPDAIVVHNPDVQTYAKLLRKAEKAGIHVVQVNMKSAFPTDAFVGADWIEIGELVTQKVIDQCGSGTSQKIAIVQGVLTAAASAYQLRGVSNILEQNPDIKVVSNQAADWDSTKARAITETTLQQHPDLCGIVGFWDGMDIGTGAAVKEAGMDEQVFLATSGGGGKTGCDNLKNDIFDVFVSYDVPGQARDLSNVVKSLLQSGNEPGKAGKVSLFTQLQTLTKDNMASYMGSGACWTVESLASN